MDDTSTAARAPRPPSTASDAPGERLHPDAVEHVVVQLRPVASPTSVGLFGLAAASFVLGGLQLGWVRPEEGGHVGVVLIGFAAVAQLVASLVAFSARDGVVATVMAVLALTWLSTGLVLLTSTPGSRSGALGLLLACSAVAVAITGATASLTKLAAAAVFLTAAVRLALTSAFELSGHSWLATAAGVVGVALAALALLVAWASEVEEARGSSPLPLGRRGKGEDAMRASFAEQTRDVATEAGVRLRL